MKNCTRNVGLLVVLAISFAATAQETSKLSFKFTTINVKGSQETDIYGIGNSGAVVGSYVDKNGIEHGLMLAGGKATNIDNPKGTGGTFCYNINTTSGAIVGYYLNSSGAAQGFLYKKGKFTDVGPAGTGSYALGINTKGVITGYYYDSSGLEHGYVRHGTKYTILDVPSATGSGAWGINDKNLISLFWIDSSGNYEGALYNGKKYTTIKVPGAVQSVAHSINNNGDVVFAWIDSSGNYHGALRMGGKYYKFNDPKGPNNTRPDGINDQRTVAGRFLATGKSTYQGFSATY